MYKKTIDLVQLRLKEYLIEKKYNRQAAKLARQENNTLLEISSNNSDESTAN
jgi:hypothetical protein